MGRIRYGIQISRRHLAAAMDQKLTPCSGTNLSVLTNPSCFKNQQIRTALPNFLEMVGLIDILCLSVTILACARTFWV